MSETEEIALAVVPRGSPSARRAVTTETPVAKWPITSRSSRRHCLGGLRWDARGCEAVRDNGRDRQGRQAVRRGEAPQVAAARGVSVVTEHLAEDRRRIPARAERKIDGRLDSAGSIEGASGTRAQRQDVARLDEVVWARRRVGSDADRAGTISG